MKNFIVKYWQWIVMLVTAIAFYLLGRSKDAKQQQVKFYEKWKELEEEQRQELVEDLGDLVEDKEDSTAENILNFEEKKAKIEEEAKKVNTDQFLELKGIKKAATLYFYKEEKDKETGKKKRIRKYFTVFNAAEVLARIETKKAA